MISNLAVLQKGLWLIYGAFVCIMVAINVSESSMKEEERSIKFVPLFCVE